MTRLVVTTALVGALLGHARPLSAQDMENVVALTQALIAWFEADD